MTVNFSERWRGTLGLRYTDEQKDVAFQRVQGDPATLWNSVINPPFNDPDLEFDDDFVNGNLNVQFDASNDVMLYAAYGLGSKTGGYAESAEVGSGDPSLGVDDGGARVETEEAQTYELGAKMTLLDGAATFNAALFYTDVDDFQETSFLVTEAGAQFLTTKYRCGIRGDRIRHRVAGKLMLCAWTAAATYADTTHSDDGSKLAQAPEWTGHIGAQFETQVTSGMLFAVSGFVRYRDDMVSQINETFPSDSMTSLDMNFSLIDVDEVMENQPDGHQPDR